MNEEMREREKRYREMEKLTKKERIKNEIEKILSSLFITEKKT